MSLSLASLGRELDNVRRARRLSDSDTATSASESAAPSESPPSPSHARPTAPPAPTESGHTMPSAQAAPQAQTQAQAVPVDQPYPLCLLCFARTPSAVLLPCCHLNLCYLCAPLLVHNATREREARTVRLERERERARELDLASLATDAAATDAAPAPTSPSTSPSTSPTSRVPWNVTLSRAVAKHPPSRRLSIGGYVAPKEGRRGGEIRGCDLLATTGEGGDLGVTRERGADGRVRLALEGEAAASCLVCRQGVSGWLRVYTG